MKHKEEDKKLILKWNIRYFLSNLEIQNNQEICESLDPKLFDSAKGAEQYWSVPERLVDIRWIYDRINASQKGNDFNEYIRLEHCLYRIVITLGNWAWAYTKSARKLAQSLRAKQEMQILWEQNRAFFEDCSSEIFQLSDEQLIGIYQFSKVLSAKTLADTRKHDLDTVAKEFTTLIVRIWGDNAEQALSLRLITPEVQQEIFRLSGELIKKAMDYFNNPLWRKDEPSEATLKELVQKIKKVLPEWDLSSAEEWTPEYIESIWTGLQKTADLVCGKFKLSSESKELSVTDMCQQVAEVMELLGLSPNAKNQLRKYTEDRGRCIALLELDGSPCLMAFSGYLDCEDEQARQSLQGSYVPDIMHAFSKISSKLGADLAVFSKDVVGSIMRYELESDCTLRNCGPLCMEMYLSSTEKGQSFIKKSYSCCERKILAKLQAQGKKPVESATLHVKFPPCLSCFGALQNWIENESIQFKLDYPPIC